jgi:lipid-A-disaccharide synthase
MRRLTDHVLCKLPFEPAWFHERGCHATYAGHPYFDELATRVLDLDRIAGLKTERRLITILPGSRDQEVAANLPMFLDVAAKVHARCSDTCFAIASFNKRQSDVAREMLLAHPALPARVAINCTAELIDAADCCLACSGSVSLELLYHAKPSVIGYRVGRFAYWAQNKFRTVKFITLVNLIDGQDIYCPAGSSVKFVADAEQALLPEFLACSDKSDDIADQLTDWLSDESKPAAVAERLRDVRRKYASPGASQRAADYIHTELVRISTVPAPRTRAA